MKTSENKLNLTKRVIEALACPAGRVSMIYYDQELAGLGVRVTDKGSKSWMLRYRTKLGAERYHTIGATTILTPDQARTEARRLLGQVATGGDPARELSARRAEPTVRLLGEHFMEWVKTQKKARTVAMYRASWTNYVLPQFGNLRAAELTLDAVEDLFVRLSDDMPIGANKVVITVIQIWKLAMRDRLIPKGPIPFYDVKQHPTPRRSRRLSLVELKRVWQALETFDALPSFAALIRLLLLTGCRVSEWRDALWSWVDWDAALLRLPDSKTGPRTVNIPPEAMEILRALPRSSVYILPGRKGGPFKGAWDAWDRLRAQLGLPDVRLHDLRRTVGSIALESGLNIREVADLLGHKEVRTTEIYLASMKDREASNAHKAAGEVVRLATGGAVAKIPKKKLA